MDLSGELCIKSNLRLQPRSLCADLAKQFSNAFFDRLKWLTGHFDETQTEGLSGEFAGLLKLRVGDYRVIYQVDRKKKIITVVEIGHRRSVYRKS